jgi:hypothetical protein
VVGDAAKTKVQPSLVANADLNNMFREMLKTAVQGMAAQDATFIANVGKHCYEKHGYSSCSLLLTKAVTYVD